MKHTLAVFSGRFWRRWFGAGRGQFALKSRAWKSLAGRTCWGKAFGTVVPTKTCGRSTSPWTRIMRNKIIANLEKRCGTAR